MAGRAAGRAAGLAVRLAALLVAAHLLLLPVAAQQPATVRIGQGQDLQAAINAARPGDTILLAAGARFRGNFILPARPAGNAFITIRTESAQLPAGGTRIEPRFSGTLALLQSANGDPVLRTAPGAHHWRIENVEFGANTDGKGNIIMLGDAGPQQRALDEVPRTIVLDRVYVHGDARLGQKRGIALNSADTSIINSYVSDIKALDVDSQAIAGWNGPGPYLIENNYLEASGENIMFGGGDPAIDGLVPQDIVIRRNLISRPVAWRDPIVAAPASVHADVDAGSGAMRAGRYVYAVSAERAAGSGGPAVSAATAAEPTDVRGGSVTVTWQPVTEASGYRVYRTSAGGTASSWRTTEPRFTDTGADGTAGKPPARGSVWIVKNLLELKNAKNVEIEGNTFENHWAGAQAGYAILFTPRNQDGRAPWSTVENVRFANNIVRHVSSAINISGTDDQRPSARTRAITIVNNVFLDVNKEPWGGSGDFLQLGAGPQNVVVEHNTVQHTGRVISVYGRPDRSQSDGFVFRGNLLRHNQYGIKGDNLAPGQATIATYFPAAVIAGNVLAGGQRSEYPAGNFFPGVQEFDARMETGLSGAGANMTAIKAAMAGDRTSEPATPRERRPDKD